MKRSLMIMIIVVLGLGIFGSLFAGENNTQLPRLGVSRYEVAQPTLSREDLLPPTNLEASVFGNNVQLTWGDPSDLPPPEGGDWITWCNINSLGNGIGTNGAAQFDVAHMYDATDLASYQGDKLYEVKFVPAEANCVYTVKVWTGGNATAPGTLVYSAVHTGFDVGMWNTHTLSTPVDIPTNRLWIGIGINTQTGYPAGCDAGPQVAGKGNMMNFGGWTELTELNDELTYNWSIQGYVANPAGGTRVLAYDRDLTGFKVYRDGALINTIMGATEMEYFDFDLPYGNYSYTVSATYTTGESVPAGPVEVSIQELDVPTDLAATVDGNDVTLQWENPEPPLTGDWITWCNTNALGNSIGTDGAVQFDVAHMFDATDLAAYQGGSLAQVKFVPAYQNCTYTVKVWTGGTASAPGSLVYSAVHQDHVVGDWNLHVLSTPVPVPSDRLWVGYHINTQGGFPAGCDDGPHVEGKGNIMNMQGWTTLYQVSSQLTFNWSIQSFVTDGASMKALTMNPIADNSPYELSSGDFSAHRFEPNRANRALLGYKVYRDGEQIAQINNPSVTTYTDWDLANGSYLYGVSAIYGNGESAQATIMVEVDFELAEAILSDSFESYADFSLAFGDWNLLDQDGANTYGFEGINFPNSGAQMSYIVFNPDNTVPPLENAAAYDGNKYLASFAAMGATNNDWLITPRMNLGSNSAIKFYAKSYTANYGLERFRVGISTLPTIIPQGFQYISGPTYVEAPANWTEYIYDLSQYDGQSIYIAIRCVSDDAFIFMLDQVSVHSSDGSDSADLTAPVDFTALKGNYPNPFNPETTINYSLKNAGKVSIDIYNQKGQLVRSLVNDTQMAGNHSVVWNGLDNNDRAVASGIYFYKMNAGKYSSTKKMIMMK